MKSTRALLPLLAALLAAACNSTEPSGESLRMSVSAQRITLQNRTDRPIYYAAFERETAALIQWAPCDAPRKCLTQVIAPGASVRFPYAELYGYRRGSTEAVVHWWHLVPEPPAGYRVDLLRTVVLRL
jgi:hypothetical protein